MAGDGVVGQDQVVVRRFSDSETVAHAAAEPLGRPRHDDDLDADGRFAGVDRARGDLDGVVRGEGRVVVRDHRHRGSTPAGFARSIDRTASPASVTWRRMTVRPRSPTISIFTVYSPSGRRGSCVMTRGASPTGYR